MDFGGEGKGTDVCIKGPEGLARGEKLIYWELGAWGIELQLGARCRYVDVDARKWQHVGIIGAC